MRASLLLLGLLLPNIFWIALDKGVWAWDQAYYGQHSVELFFRLVYAPKTWPGAMTHVLGRQAPAITWIGQWFVPLGMTIGSIDAGLLLSMLAMQAVALFLVYRAIWELSGGRLSSAITALIVMAAAPLAIAMSHYYLVESSQAAAVAWFVLLASCAPRWPRLTIASQLVLATAFAMLAKVSSPLFCIVPGLVAVYFMLRPGATARAVPRWRTAIELTCAVALGLMTVVWYARNWKLVAVHVLMASTGSVAELYGQQLPFLASLREWLVALHASFLSPLSTTVVIIVLASAVITAIVGRVKRGERAEPFGWAAALAAVQVVLVLSVFSRSANRDTRYLLPLLPYLALLIAWAVWRLRMRALTLIVLAVFALQWGQAHAQAFALIARFPDTSPWLNPYNGDRIRPAIVNALVARTCADKTYTGYRNAVGVQLLWLNPPALAYAAAKMFAPANAKHCEYDAIAYFAADADEAWRTLLNNNIHYYIAVDAKAEPIPDTALDRTVNQLNAPILRRIEDSGQFARQPPLAEHAGIWIFKRFDADLDDRVAFGRALSDQGQHQQAMAMLRAAAARQPKNVEAWANLALACERGGDLDGALAAGERARELDPRHYYVNLGLARVLRLQGQQAFDARDETRGCERLRRARDLQPADRDIVAALSSHGCVR